MVDEYTILASVVSGGLAGALFTFIGSRWLDKRKQDQLKQSVRALVKYDLKTTRDVIQAQLLASTQLRDTYYFAEDSKEIQTLDQVIDSLQYSNLTTEIKIISFESSAYNEIQDIYLKIKSLKTFRATREGHAIRAYGSSYLINFVADLDSEINKLDVPAPHRYLYPPE